MRLEAWSEEPPDPGREWPDVQEVGLALTSGRVRLWTVTMGPSDRIFTLGGAGRYRLRVACRGHDEALAIAMAGGRIPDGTERYLLQFWGDDRGPLTDAGPIRAHARR